MVLTDNFGIMFSKIFRPPSNSISSKASLIDITDTAFLFDMWSPGANFFRSGSTLAQIGDGTTTPTPQDTKIEQAFSNAPENSRVGSALWGITAEKTQAQTSIIAVQENGQVKEIGLFKSAQDNTGTPRTIMIARDVVTPETFNINDNVLIEHSMELA